MSEVFVESLQDFENLDKKTGLRINYYCQSCGTLSSFIYKTCREKTQRRLLCAKCAMISTNLEKYGVEYSSQAKSAKDKISAKLRKDAPNEIFVSSVEDFDNANKKTNTIISYNCLSCGELSSIKFQQSKLESIRRLLCTKCKKNNPTKQKFMFSDINEFYKSLDAIKDGDRFTCTCQSCSKNFTLSFRKDRHFNGFKMLCFSCKKSETELQKFGFPYSSMSNDVKEKIKQTNLERYGTTCTFQTDKSKEHARESCQKKFNVDYPFQNQEVLKKCQETMLRLYGTDNALKKDSPFYQDAKLKNQQVCLEKYNSKSSLGSKEVQQKIKETFIKKYGYEYPSQNIEVQIKAQNTCIKRFGVPHFAQTKASRQHRRTRYTFNNEKFDSSWELAFYIYAIDHKEDIVHEPITLEYVFNDKVHYYFPDFLYLGQLIEIKGDQFFKKDGTMQNPYDHSLDGLAEAKQKCAIENNVKFLRKCDIQNMIDYVVTTYGKTYLDSFKCCH